MPGYTVITGASEGLGKALAIECAKQNMDLVLVSLPGIELSRLSSYIRQRYKVKVFKLETDLSCPQNCRRLWKTIREQGLPVNMLINNAGIGGSRKFESADFSLWQKHIAVNISGTIHLTHLLLPELKKHPQSFILNVSSLAVFFYLPEKQVYGATKSFIYFFSKSLRRELRNENIHVTVLCPGGINSSPVHYLMNNRSNWITRASSLSPEEVAQTALKGLLEKKERIIPGRWNRLFFFAGKMLPNFIKEKLICSQPISIKQQYAEALVKGNLSLTPQTI